MFHQHFGAFPNRQKLVAMTICQPKVLQVRFWKPGALNCRNGTLFVDEPGKRQQRESKFEACDSRGFGNGLRIMPIMP